MVKHMKAISLVPSLTETLVECGVDVVGRTQHCIHPGEKVSDIAVVLDHQGVDWNDCSQLQPDLVIFDHEEAAQQGFATECPFPWEATNITSVDKVAVELDRLANRLDSSSLAELAKGWDDIARTPNRHFNGWDDIPGVIQWLNNDKNEYKKLQFIVWQEPWVAIGPQTFIGSVLQKLGLGEFHVDTGEQYPILSDIEMMDDDTFYLFSSQPYSFEKHYEMLKQSGVNGAIVDGERFTWFGLRSYNYLAQALSRH